MADGTFVGAAVPLFDRLVDTANVADPDGSCAGTDPDGSPDDAPPGAGMERLTSPDGRHLTLAGLHASVERELTRLLGTRIPVGEALLSEGPRTVLTYGIPDFGTVTESSDGNRKRLQSEILAAITAFEPRLRGVTVDLQRVSGSASTTTPGESGHWLAVIDGELIAGPRRVAARFVTPLRPGTPNLAAFSQAER